VVICLERGADCLHMVQLMLLPSPNPIISCLIQTVHTHHASVHQAAKLVAAVLRVARVTAGLAESNGSLPAGL